MIAPIAPRGRPVDRTIRVLKTIGPSFPAPAQSQAEAAVSKGRDLCRIRVKGLAVPVERGGWDFLSEPILRGLSAAPSVAGALLSASAVFVFLLRQPLRVLVTGAVCILIVAAGYRRGGAP